MIGPRAQAVAKLTANWDTPEPHRRVLLLLAMYTDAGERSPRARDLVERAMLDVQALDRVLGQLGAGGLIWTRRRAGERNTYFLICLGDEVPLDDRERHTRFSVYQQRRRKRIDGR